MKLQELTAQTRSEHDAWLEAQHQNVERQAWTFSNETSGMSKKELATLCEEYGIEPSSPAKMRVALQQAFRTGEFQAINEMHRMWLAAN